jgi:4-alpha-glucanotransferase
MFWIPDGLDFKDGVYVRHPAEELYAILSLESHRHRSTIVGENLGIVPSYVNRSMARHNIQKMYLMQYALRPDPRRPMKPIPAGSVASLNTHDTPLFAAFWQGLDIEDRLALGLLDSEGARKERKARRARKKALLAYLERRGTIRRQSGRPEISSVLEACLARLRASRASVVLVNLEDLWLETKPQNVPGSGESHPNWQRKLRYSLEELHLRSRGPEMLRRVLGATEPNRRHAAIQRTARRKK